MKASPRQQQLLLELQDLDNTVARLQRRRSQLPVRQQLTSLQERLGPAKSEFMEVQRELDAQSAEISRYESDVETVRARRQRDSELLARSTSPKEATALQNELETLARRQTELENRELELMELHEQAQQRFEAAAATLAEIDLQREQLSGALASDEAQIDREIASATDARAGLAAEVQRDLLQHYEGLRTRLGVGAARLRGKVSEASNMELAPAELADILAAAPDELVHCPQSGAILVREFDELPA